MTTELDLSLPAVPASIRDARNAVADLVQRLGGSEDLTEDVRLCVSEAATNVVRHAYRQPGGKLGLSVEHAAGELTVTVYDSGEGMSAFREDGDLGYGLRIMDWLAARCDISSTPHTGTAVRLIFVLEPLVTGAPARRDMPPVVEFSRWRAEPGYPTHVG
jgi:anti-sigma regulatory factor (Ser/Thr protein kinase)